MGMLSKKDMAVIHGPGAWCKVVNQPIPERLKPQDYLVSLGCHYEFGAYSIIAQKG